MKNERRRGIGKRIMEKIEKIVKENKGEELSLHVRASNKDAIGFYRSLGFQEIMIFEKVYNDGEDAIYMKKKID
jgi:ribosomal-protein-alanine N-acetyltransferase